MNKKPTDTTTRDTALYNTRQRVDEADATGDSAGVESLKGFGFQDPPTLTSTDNTKKKHPGKKDNAHDQMEAETRVDATRGLLVRGDRLEVPDITDVFRRAVYGKNVPEFYHTQDKPQKLNPVPDTMNDNIQDDDEHNIPEEPWPRRGL